MTYILEATHLNKYLPTQVNQDNHILKNINLQIKEGEYITVMGASGSGKSTLLYNLSGMDKPSTGKVIFDGHSLTLLSETQLSDMRLKKMGFVFQQPYLLKHLNLLDNIIVAAYLKRAESLADINHNALSLMKKMGIDTLANHDITQASGGQLQRVSICRALMNHPRIIFGDEPTGALNSKTTTEILDILSEIYQQGTTIMLVTHDVKVAAHSERVLFMLDGSLIAEKKLGKLHEKQALPAREACLTEWLAKQGF